MPITRSYSLWNLRNYSATTRTGVLGWRLSNHNSFWKTKILIFFGKRTNKILRFEGCFLRGQVSSNGFKVFNGLHCWTLNFIGPFAKKLENLEKLENVVIGYSSSKCPGSSSLRKQPTFGDATTGFPAKWRLRNKRRNSILMTRHYPDLGRDTSSVWNFCARFSDVISRRNRWWRLEMSAVFSGYGSSSRTVIVNDNIWASFQTNNVFQGLYQTLQTTKVNFENLLGWQVFKNHNCNPFQSSSSFVHPCFLLYLVCYLYLRLMFWSTQFGGRCYCLNFYIRDTAPLISFCGWYLNWLIHCHKIHCAI